MFRITLVVFVALVCAQASPIEEKDGFIFMGTFSSLGKNSKYYLSAVDNTKSLSNARLDCFNNEDEFEGNSRKLVTIEDAAEENVLRVQLGTWQINDKVWTAAEKNGEDWVWYDQATGIITDCDLCDENLAGGNSGDGAIIGGVGLGYGWALSDSNDKRRFICESVEIEEITEEPTTATTPEPPKSEPTTQEPPTPSECGTSPSPPIDFSCTGKPDGNYGNPNNCCSYLACVAGKVKYTMPCAANLHYDWRSIPGQDTSGSYCNYPQFAKCPLRECLTSSSPAWCYHDSHCCSGSCSLGPFLYGFGHCA